MDKPGKQRRLGLGGVGQVLGVPRLTVWWWVKTRQLHATGIEDGVLWWDPTDVYSWALGFGSPDLSGRVPLREWKPASQPAAYLGAVDLPGAVAQRWETCYGTVSMVWPLPGEKQASIKVWAQQLEPRGTGTVTVVTSRFSLGPELTNILPALPERETSHPRWAHVSRVVGRPLPYWPTQLRQRKLIHEWEPGAQPVTAMAVPTLDTTVLLQMASMYDTGHASNRVLVNLARMAHAQGADSAKQDLSLLASSGSCAEDGLLIAAQPMLVPDAELSDVDATQRRAGWLELLGRKDKLAAACVTEVAKWDSGADLPFGNPAEIAFPGSRWARQWSQRLHPTARTAAFELLDDGTGETLTDPATDAPVVRKPDGRLLAAVPQRLPATAPLAQLILDKPIWVRTADDTLYPAPQDSYYALGWGYVGSGPGALALLVDALLDDINAKAPSDINGAPEGLEKLMQRPFPHGTVLTRKQLEAARRDEPMMFLVAPDGDDDTDDE